MFLGLKDDQKIGKIWEIVLTHFFTDSSHFFSDKSHFVLFADKNYSF